MGTPGYRRQGWNFHGGKIFERPLQKHFRRGKISGVQQVRWKNPDSLPIILVPLLGQNLKAQPPVTHTPDRMSMGVNGASYDAAFGPSDEAVMFKTNSSSVDVRNARIGTDGSSSSQAGYKPTNSLFELSTFYTW